MSQIAIGKSKPPSRRHRCCSTLAGFAALVLLSGCGEGPKAEFSWRPSTTDLVRDAEKAAQKVITDNFGTPHDLVGWERMPVNYGGVRAEVAEAVDKTTVKLVLLDPQHIEHIQRGQSIVWLKQAESDRKYIIQVLNFDAKNLLMGFHDPGNSAPVPAVGDKLLIGFGSQLQLGRVVYMKNCLHCHGVAGDGAGPTARYLNPRPRDYRLGLFKFTSTLSPERATRDDLARIVKYGIPGTYMPSFLLMKDDETTAVVEYVRWLAMRGEMEKRLGDELADYNEANLRKDAERAEESYKAALKAGEKPEKPSSVSQVLAAAKTGFAEYEKTDFPGVIDETANILAEAWQRAEEESSLIFPKTPRVADTPESRQRGRLLYMSNKTKCYTCHGPQGRGDGGAVEDFWPKPGSATEKYAQRGLHDFWGNKLQPRDLTKGQYRGGRRPLDLYRRLFAGIKGTPMPAFGGTVLKDEEIWDVVNYVMSVPFESSAPASPKPAEMAASSERN